MINQYLSNSRRQIQGTQFRLRTISNTTLASLQLEGSPSCFSLPQIMHYYAMIFSTRLAYKSRTIATVYAARKPAAAMIMFEPSAIEYHC